MTLAPNNPEAARICREALGRDICEPFIGFVIPSGGAVIVNDWDHGNAEITAVVTGPVPLGFARQFARYMFVQLKCTRVTARTRASNAACLKALAMLGFRPEGVARAWFGDEDAILFGLLRGECRLIKVMP